MTSVITVGLAIGVFEFMTGVAIMPGGWELTPVTEGFFIVASIAMMLMGAFPFGDHLGFVAGAERTMIVPVIAGKAVGGVTAIALVLLLFGRTLPTAHKNQDVEQEGTAPARASD